jgi:uncharacterized OB-fold protein
MTEQLHGIIEPAIDADATTFWDGVASHRLLVPTCLACGTAFLPPLPCCPACQSELIEHVEAEGTGTLYSWVVMRRALDAAYADAVPYVVAAVELREGARLFARLVHVDIDAPGALTAGMALQLVFVDIDGRPMWAFEPAALA